MDKEELITRLDTIQAKICEIHESMSELDGQMEYLLSELREEEKENENV